MKIKIINSIILLLSPLTFTSCNKPYRIYSALGDSLTYGQTPTKEFGQLESPFPKVVQESLGFNENQNLGVPGSTISSNIFLEGAEPMYERAHRIKENSNVVSILGGINDYRSNTTIGTIDSNDTSTICGALNNIIDTVKNCCPNAFIFLMTPTPFTIKEPSNGTYEFSNVCDAIKSVGNNRNIKVLDLYTNSGFEEEMIKPESDGIHPNQEFVNNKLAPMIVNFIKDNTNY